MDRQECLLYFYMFNLLFLNSFPFLFGGELKCQDSPLPPPRHELAIDSTSGDAELFKQYFVPDGSASVDHLGDLWCDVSLLKKTLMLKKHC